MYADPPRLNTGSRATREFFAIVCFFVAIKLALHFLTSGGYGYFRDELYYIVCGQRLDWGYVDHPPVTPLVAYIGRALFGHTMFAVRFFPAVSGAVTIVIAALTAREFGGGRFAVALTCLAMLVAPHYLGSQAKLATDSMEPPFWAGCAYLLLRAIKENSPRWWLWIGVVAGLGLETKHSIAFYLFALIAGLLLTPERRLLFNRYFVGFAVIAFALALPNLIWEWRHHWATYELLSNVAHSNKNVVLGPVQYFAQQLLLIGPVTSPIWLTGLIALFAWRELRPYRVFAFSYALALALFIVLKGKNYYLAPAYPLLIAAGAVVIERFTEFRMRWLRPAYIATIALFSLLVLPFTVPVLSPAHFVAFQQRLGVHVPKTEHSHTAVMPQHFADRFGWDELAANVGHVFHSLSPAEQRIAGIFAQNYGDAGAIDVLGEGLPPALSGHQNYFLWGPRGYTGEVLIVIDDNSVDLERQCETVEDRGPAMTSPYALPFELRQHIYVCRKLDPPLPQLWPELKTWL